MNKIFQDIVCLATLLERKGLKAEAAIASGLIRKMSSQANITPDTAAYQAPNPDFSRKRCGNCAFWVPSGRCGLLDNKTKVTARMVCNNYVFGPNMGSLLSG